MVALFSDNEPKEENSLCNKRFVLMDAVDSGYSIDNIVDLKEFFHVMMADAKKLGIELYIVVSANEYELASDEACLDVTTGQYLKFDNYGSFKSFILKSREKKDARVQ